MKQPGSNFVSWVGLALLAALVLVAAYFDLAALESFLIIILLLCLAAFLWGRLSLRKIEVEAEYEESCGFPGQTLELPCSLRNRKLLPLIWLDLCFPIGAKTCLAPMPDSVPDETQAGKQKDRELRSSFLWVMPHQRIRWNQQALAVHRGICRVDSVRLYSGDGFGLSTQTGKAALPCAVRFVVYPKIVPVDVSLILNNMREMESARNGFYTDRTLLETTRDYCDGDSFKNINWRLLAKKDELHVNVYEKLTMRRVCFMPDLFSFTHLEEISEDNIKHTERVVERDEMEEMFSLMASIIVKLHERGVLCALAVPAIGDTPERVIVPETAETQVMELLGALAEIEYAAEEVSLPYETIARERHKLGQLYLMSRSSQRSVLHGDARAAEELGAINIVQDSPAAGESDRGIFTETDFRNP